MANLLESAAIAEAKGDLKCLIEILLKIIRIYPQKISYKAKLVESYLLANQKDIARQYLNEVVASLKSEKRLNDLAAFYERIIELDPQNIKVINDCIKNYLELKDAGKALRKISLLMPEFKENKDILKLFLKAYEILGKQNKINIIQEKLKLCG